MVESVNEEDVSPRGEWIIEVRAAAADYLATQASIDNSPEPVEDDDPRWAAFLRANNRFTDAVGFGFCAEAQDVAELMLAVIPAPESDIHADGPPHGKGGLRRCVLCDEVWPCSAILSELEPLS